MSNSLAITPSGRLQLVEAADETASLSEALAADLQSALAESTAAGLMLLATPPFAESGAAEIVFWRGFAVQFFQAACQFEEATAERWKTVSPPSDDRCEQLLSSAPPMRGLEYLTADLLRRLWSELNADVAQRAAAFHGGPAAYLQSVNPVWHFLGRVTFHLAENKRDPARPFAFLATYTHRLSGQTKLAHLPLAEALKNYATARDREKLDSLLAPVRRAAERSGLIGELLKSKALFAPQAWTIRQAHRFLTETLLMEQAGVVVRVPDWWSARRPPRPQVRVQIGERPASQLGFDSLLDFRVGVALDGVELTAEERAQLLADNEGLVLLRGKWVEVDRKRLQEALDHWHALAKEHPSGLDFVQGMRLLAGAQLDADDADAERTAAWSHVAAGDWLKKTLEQMRDPQAAANCQPGRDLQATLRPYQADGVRWLWLLTQLGLGACLADDMGLGKTIQVIDLVLQRKRSAHGSPHAPREAPRGGRRASPDGHRHAERDGYEPPNLLVVPASLIGNWKQELTRFAPQLRVLLLHRSEISAEELDRLAADPRQGLAGYDLVITTYGLVRRVEWLATQPWSLVVLDEAQAIKNPASAQARGVKKLSAQARILLTGTPVENHLGDLWSLFDFCSPGLLGNANQFKRYLKRIGQQQDTEAFGALRRLVRPYILRRMKTDPTVAPDLPAKTEMRTECGLSKKQAALYERVVSDLSKRLETADGIARRGLVLSSLMQLKQICNHPAQFLSSGNFSEADSGKFERLRLLGEPIAQRQERALIFTQFQSLTQPLADFLATVFGRPGIVLHGGTPIRKRAELVRAFQDDAGPPFFVVSLKAGGSGLNLTAASHVIHFDRWWNPAVENQATDRAFRIGQKRKVLVHKFVCRGTVEERIDAMLIAKQGLADQILDAAAETSLTEMTNAELLRFVSLDISRAAAES